MRSQQKAKREAKRGLLGCLCLELQEFCVLEYWVQRMGPLVGGGESWSCPRKCGLKMRASLSHRLRAFCLQVSIGKLQEVCVIISVSPTYLTWRMEWGWGSCRQRHSSEVLEK